MKTFKNTAELIAAWPKLDADVRAALAGAISTRGKWAGYMLSNAPNAGRGAHRTAWLALIAEVAPARTSVWGILSMPAEQRELFDRIQVALDSGLGAGVAVYEPGFRWSMLAHHADLEAARAGAYAYCEIAALEQAGQNRLFA